MQRKSVITACIDRLTSSGLECAIKYDTVTDATCKGFESSHQSPAKSSSIQHGDDDDDDDDGGLLY